MVGHEARGFGLPSKGGPVTVALCNLCAGPAAAAPIAYEVPAGIANAVTIRLLKVKPGIVERIVGRGEILAPKTLPGRLEGDGLEWAPLSFANLVIACREAGLSDPEPAGAPFAWVSRPRRVESVS